MQNLEEEQAMGDCHYTSTTPQAANGGYPPYDIVAQPRRDGDDASRLTLGIGKQGRVATLDNALSRWADFDLDLPKAREIAQSMTALVRENWREQNERAGVPEVKIRLIEEAYRGAVSGEK
jgi:serine/threonine-protein kinase HipA